MIEQIKKYIDAGVIVMPVDKSKRPILGGWQKLTIEDCRKPEFLNHWNSPDMKVGLLCGGQNQAEALDMDLKNSLNSNLFAEYCALVKESDPNLLKKLTVQKTISGGYHLIYKCTKIQPNQKLSRRPATHDEMLNDNAKCFVELETRGANGMIVIAPSQGYELKQGSFENIQFITEEERDLLLTVARSFNTYDQPHIKTKFASPIKGTTIWEEFNSDTQAGLDLLEVNGWTQVRTKGDDILLKRPGNTTAPYSAYYHTRSNVFVPFTTSSEFDTERGYSNSQILHIIEGHSDWSKTAERLKDMGYGKVEYNDTTKAKKVQQDEEKGVKIKSNEDVHSYIEDSRLYIEYLEKSRMGTLERGLTTGSRYLDAHFLFKRGNFVVTNGFPSAGKSFVWWYLACLSNKLHGWRWLIYSSENKTGQVIKKLIEFISETKIDNLSQQQLNEYRLYIDDNFRFINIDQSYTAKDILKIAEEFFQSWKYDGLLIDPYNSLMVGNKANTHQYHYEVVTQFRSFSNRTGIYVSLLVHPNTNAARNSKVPTAADTEGGVMFWNRCDEFISLSREVSDPNTYRQTNIHVRKVKDMESGGRPTPLEQPVVITLMDGVSFVDENQVRLLSGKLYHHKEEAPKQLAAPLTPNTNFDNPFPSDEPIPF